MDLSKLSLVFRVVFIAVIYIIIFVALKIMYKDIKNGGKKKARRKSIGLEVIQAYEDENLKAGSVIPIRGQITIGRKGNNNLILEDPYVSSNHARIFLKNNEYILEDLGSTNGTVYNNKTLMNKVFLKKGDIIQIGQYVFRVIV